MNPMDNYFTTLNSVNVNGKTEKKNGLTYLSWAWAWGEIKKVVPDAVYTIYERETEFGPVNYFTDGRTCWVKTGVTIGVGEKDSTRVKAGGGMNVSATDKSKLNCSATFGPPHHFLQRKQISPVCD